jgi:hypothetical protein
MWNCTRNCGKPPLSVIWKKSLVWWTVDSMSTKEICMGKIIGRVPSESGFVGNMYIEARLDGEEIVIEIGSTQVSQNRGRVLMTGAPLLSLKKMAYYSRI